jgi:hypothetical protein
MADYDFRGLSPRSFEHFIQALCIKFLGPGVSVFGDGPDGGREATFRGRINFPTTVEQWDGYGIIQAKFRQRPSDNPADNLKWARRELSKELSKFNRKKTLRPEYYIFATNVVLTPGTGGGKDQLEELLRRQRTRIGLKDWRIWDYDQARAFIDNAEDIRNAYRAWVTPGDVLAAAIESIQNPLHSEALSNALSSFVAKDLYADQYANLEQAGHSVEDKVPLARVFVDLPVSENPVFANLEYSLSDTRVSYFLTEIIEAAKEKLDPSALVGARQNPASGHNGRFVLIGGPGQGKTTLGQFTCQVFRASILRDRPGKTLSAEVRRALSGILQQCASEGIDLPATRRFPIRVILSEFADALERTNGALSLIDYVAKRISMRSGFTIDADALRHWISAYPWLLVLDGLDEVPPSSNREQVLSAIADFWSDVAVLNGDVLVVATTRPQGYSEDFYPDLYRHLTLVPLQPVSALKYAARLIAERYGNDHDRSKKISSRLRQALQLDSTQKLMTTPLQVTIMATLVDQIGQPPQDRWRLFHDYYEVIFRREMERDIPAARLLRERRKDIDTIHNRVALLLQVETERSGGAEAKLDVDRFKAIVAARLKEEGYSGQEEKKLVSDIVEAAANRLVFLVGLQANQIGFEIRSLQEFMAAEALMDGGEMALQARLERIAPIASWRNVFLFAAGKCFAEAQHLRDTVVRICAQLNVGANDPLYRTGRLGSKLAADLLADGVANRQPKYASLLFSCAGELLDARSFPGDGKLLAAAYGPSLDPHFQAALEPIITSRSFYQSVSAWGLVLHLAGAGVGWASELAKKSFPESPTEFAQLVWRHNDVAVRRWLAGNVAREQLYRLPIRVVDHLSLAEPEVRGKNTNFRTIAAVPELAQVENGWFEVGRAPMRHRMVTGVLMSVSAARQPMPNTPLPVDAHRHWVASRELIAAAEHLSSKRLAIALRNIAYIDLSMSASDWDSINLPWPVAAFLRYQQVAPMDFVEAADRLENGILGDVQDWLVAEGRLRSHGLTLEDVAAMTDERWPFGLFLRDVGAPIAAINWIRRSPHGLKEFIDLFDVAIPQSRCQLVLAHAVKDLLYWDRPSSPIDISAEKVLRILEIVGDYKIDAAVLDALCEGGASVTELKPLIERVAETVWVGPGAHKALTTFLSAHRGELGAAADLLTCKLISRSDSGIHKTITGGRVDASGDSFLRAQLAVLLGETSPALRVQLLNFAKAEPTAGLLLDMFVKREVEFGAETVLPFLGGIGGDMDIWRNEKVGLAVKQVIDRRRSDLEQPSVWRELELPVDMIPILRRES